MDRNAYSFSFKKKMNDKDAITHKIGTKGDWLKMSNAPKRQRFGQTAGSGRNVLKRPFRGL
jgi:hypothetical protein